MRRTISVATGLALGAVAFATPAQAAVATKVTVKVDHAPAYIGDEVTVSGKLTRSNGAPLGGRNLLLEMGGEQKIVTTNGDGLYIAELHSEGSDAFVAKFLASGSYSASRAATAYYALQYRTDIARFSVRPRPAVKNSIISVTGRTEKLTPAGNRVLPAAGLDLITSTDGGKVWNYSASTTSDSKGNFKFTPVAGADARWKVVLKPNLVANGWLQDEREAWVDTRYRTRVSVHAKAKARYNSRFSVHGTLQHRTDGSWTALGRTRVAVYFRARGTKTWKFKAWAWVDARGKYSKKFTAKRDGYWRVNYKGNGENFWTTSGRVYNDVR